MERVSTVASNFGEGGGGFAFPENSRIRITGAEIKRRHKDAFKAKDGREVAAKDDTIIRLEGVVVGDEEKVIAHELGCGNVLMPSEDGKYFVTDKPGAQLVRSTGAARFFASLLEVGAQDGSYTEEHDRARDEDISSLIGMEFQTGLLLVPGDGKIQDYKTMVATAVWVAPGGGNSEGDAAAEEVANVLKGLIDATKGAAGLTKIQASTQLSKPGVLSDAAKSVFVDLLKSDEFLQQGVANQYWKYDKTKAGGTFTKAA